MWKVKPITLLDDQGQLVKVASTIQNEKGDFIGRPTGEGFYPASFASKAACETKVDMLNFLDRPKEVENHEWKVGDEALRDGVKVQITAITSKSFAIAYPVEHGPGQILEFPLSCFEELTPVDAVSTPEQIRYADLQKGDLISREWDDPDRSISIYEVINPQIESNNVALVEILHSDYRESGSRCYFPDAEIEANFHRTTEEEKRKYLKPDSFFDKLQKGDIVTRERDDSDRGVSIYEVIEPQNELETGTKVKVLHSDSGYIGDRNTIPAWKINKNCHLTTEEEKKKYLELTETLFDELEIGDVVTYCWGQETPSIYKVTLKGSLSINVEILHSPQKNLTSGISNISATSVNKNCHRTTDEEKRKYLQKTEEEKENLLISPWADRVGTLSELAVPIFSTPVRKPWVDDLKVGDYFTKTNHDGTLRTIYQVTYIETFESVISFSITVVIDTRDTEWMLTFVSAERLRSDDFRPTTQEEKELWSIGVKPDENEEGTKFPKVHRGDLITEIDEDGNLTVFRYYSRSSVQVWMTVVWTNHPNGKAGEITMIEIDERFYSKFHHTTDVEWWKYVRKV